MGLIVRPAVAGDAKAVAALMGDWAGVRSTRARCLKVSTSLIGEAVRSRRKRLVRDVAWVACAEGGEVRGFAAGCWAYAHGLFEDVQVLYLTHIGGRRGVLLALLNRLRREARGGHLMFVPLTEAPYTTSAEAGRRLERALGGLGLRPVGTAWAEEVR